jgi:hypothetical protein
VYELRNAKTRVITVLVTEQDATYLFRRQRIVLWSHCITSVIGWEAVGRRTLCVYVTLYESVHCLLTIGCPQVSRVLLAM